MHAGKSALIVLAWFGAGNGTAPTNQPPSHVELRFDWSAIGINATTARLHAPQIAPSNPGLENFACHGVSPSRARASTPQHHSTTLEYTIERTCLALHCLAPPHVFAARFVCLLSYLFSLENSLLNVVHVYDTCVEAKHAEPRREPRFQCSNTSTESLQQRQCDEARRLSVSQPVPLLTGDHARSIGDHGIILLLDESSKVSSLH